MSAYNDIVQAQTELLRKGSMCGNVTIKCKDRIWRCNSNILSQRCDFFKAACEGSFQVKLHMSPFIVCGQLNVIDLQEAQTGEIKLGDDHPDAVDALLLYLYTLQVPCLNAHPDLHAVARAANKYGIEQLEREVIRLLEQKITSGLRKFGGMSASTKSKWVIYFTFLWTTTDLWAEQLKQHLLSCLPDAAEHLAEMEDFMALLEHSDFSKAYIKTLTIRLANASNQGIRDIPD